MKAPHAADKIFRRAAFKIGSILSRNDLYKAGSDVLDALVVAADVLHELGLDSMLIGSGATVYYGGTKPTLIAEMPSLPLRTRYMADVDFLVPEGSLERIAEAFPGRVKQQPGTTERQGVTERHLVVEYRGVDIDFFEGASVHIDGETYRFPGIEDLAKHKSTTRIAGRDIEVIPLENHILGKVLADRHYGWKNDPKDISGMIRQNVDTLDLDYLLDQAARIGIPPGNKPLWRTISELIGYRSANSTEYWDSLETTVRDYDNRLESTERAVSA